MGRRVIQECPDASIDSYDALQQENDQLRQALVESEERNQRLFEAAPSGVAILDQFGNIAAINQNMTRISGYTLEEAKVLGMQALYPDPELRQELLGVLAGSGKTQDREVWLKRKDGVAYDALLNSKQIELRGQKALLISTRDVTQPKRMEEELRESEEKYRMLVENSLQGLAIIQDNKIVFCTNAYAEITGYSVEELLSFSDTRGLVYPHDRELVFGNYREKPADKSIPPRYEHRITRKDGTERWVDIYASPTSYKGKAAVQIVDVDITERKKAESALRESEERFRLITETMNEVFWVLDVQNDRVLYISPAHERLWGYPRQSIYNDRQSYFAPIHSDDRERVRAAIDLMKTGQELEYEYRIVRPDGTIRQIWERGFPIHDENGRVERYVGVAQDVTAWRHAEKALRESMEYLKQLINHIGDPLFVIDRQHRFVLVNDAMCAFSGLKRERLLGKTIRQLRLPKDETDSIWKQESLVFESGQDSVVEEQVTNAQGNTRTVVAKKTLLTDHADSVQIVGIIRDITERKGMEEELWKSELKHRTLLEQLLQGLAIFQDSRIVFCNQAYADIFGYSVEELLSFSPHQVLALTHADDQEFVLGSLRDRLAGKPVPPRHEHRGIRKNGTVCWLEIFASLIEYEGRPAAQVVFMDISERKHADESLRQALAWQEAIFEGSRDAILISDDKARFVAANAAACTLTGYSKDELLRMHAADLQVERNVPIIEALLKRILSGEDVLGETQILTKDGRKVDVEFGHHRVMISGVTYVNGLARDITNRKRLEAQLRQAQKMEGIGVLAGGVAHDFNNLLSVIKGYTELVMEDLPPDDPRCPDLEQVKKAGEQAASLTSQLLAFSRKQILQPDFLNLNEMVVEMSAMLRRLIGEDIELVAIARPDLELIHADPGQVRQIIMNLAVNARDAMPRGGKLTIETANVELDESYVRGHPSVGEGPYVMLAISDNGVGMDAATQARIFEPFFTTKGQGRGTGLGLSTVYGIVNQSNGFIWVYSEPGEGTTFKIYFPRVEGKSARASVVTKSESAFRGSETVLVTEDEESVRALASRILGTRGYNVLEAPNGKEALEVVRRYPGKIHLVVTDVVMPGMSGKELVSQLETLRPGIKALYISGYTDNAIVHHGTLDPSVAFLQKPFTVESLAGKVRKVIDSA